VNYLHGVADHGGEDGAQRERGEGEGAEVAHEHGAHGVNPAVQQIHDHDGASQAALLAHFAPHPPRRALLLRVTAQSSRHGSRAAARP
jgi:hypothetical protein